MWEEKFLARAKRKGYKNVLLRKEAAPKDSVVIGKNICREGRNEEEICKQIGI